MKVSIKNIEKFKKQEEWTIEFYRLLDVDSNNFKEAISIYEESFPANERHASSIIKDRVENGSYKMIMGRLGEKNVFMSLFWNLRGSAFTLFDYMAVKEGYRDRGIGTGFMKNISSIVGDTSKYILLEVENPKYGENKSQRERRVSFYKRFGIMELKHVRYVLPPLSGNEPTEMILMIVPAYEGGNMPGHLVKKLIVQIFDELYSRSKDDELLNSFIHHVPDTVELE